ncbi:MAG: DUF4227 family protein [Clostridia bacterium]
MIISVRRLLELLRFLLVLITCTLISYGIITLLSERFLPANPYHEPRGNAIKVVKIIDTSMQHDMEWYDSRLQLFFMVGE